MEQKKQIEKKNDLVGPRYSILIPFCPSMGNLKLLFNLLKTAVDKAEKEILIRYSKEQGFPLIKGLRELIKGIKPVRNEKTLAIFVSEFSKKIYYFTPTKRDYMPTVYIQSKKDIF